MRFESNGIVIDDSLHRATFIIRSGANVSEGVATLELDAR
jgi:hypothetical protein